LPRHKVRSFSDETKDGFAERLRFADEFARCAVHFIPTQKRDRAAGWEKMRRMLADAEKVDVPGLYITRTASYFWSTVPHLPRDQKRIEDVDSSGADHGADACRYGLLRQSRMASVTPLVM
jgi:hypothetical protein